ncbi:helix-turn-helix transcriptional regulator [Sphingobium yanoikuyae]|jgi:prophage regulatory protein|uniref:helix-turn-helix transcriptional regulator n=1 Tax=Sphingobium yanoikuyae TaxID=13690 RepID=UPI00296F8939
MTNPRALNTNWNVAHGAIPEPRAGSDELARLIASLAAALGDRPEKDRQSLIAAIVPIYMSHMSAELPSVINRPVSRFLRLPEVLRRTGLKRSTLYNKIAADSFPPQVKISNNCTAWREEEIEQWCANPK